VLYEYEKVRPCPAGLGSRTGAGSRLGLAFFQRGVVHEELGNFDEALANYNKALVYNPKYMPAMEGRSRVRGKVPIRFGKNRNTKKGNGCSLNFVFYIFLCLIVCPLMVYLGASEIYNEKELVNRGLVTNAILTNARSETKNGRTTYEVQYKYTVNGGYTWYTCSDNTGRVNLWCPLTSAEWRSSRSTGQTKIKYLPDRPWINRLVYHDPPSNLFDNLAAVILGICMFLVVGFLGLRKGT